MCRGVRVFPNAFFRSRVQQKRKTERSESVPLFPVMKFKIKKKNPSAIAAD